jgi:hypothetical protein
MTRRKAGPFPRFLALAGLAWAGATSCGGGSGASSATCSSCQTAYTQEQCERWGTKAGCKSATVTQDGTCAAGIAGCAFADCKGGPICDDTGHAMCASCSGDYTAGDCNKFAGPPECATPETIKVQACEHDAVGCVFTGCNFEPTCR